MSATVMLGRTSAESMTSSASLTRSRASSVDHLVEMIGATGRSAAGNSRALSARSRASSQGASQPPSSTSAAMADRTRSEEHTSELQSLMRISYAVFCLKTKTHNNMYTKLHTHNTHNT